MDDVRGTSLALLHLSGASVLNVMLDTRQKRIAHLRRDDLNEATDVKIPITFPFHDPPIHHVSPSPHHHPHEDAMRDLELTEK